LKPNSYDKSFKNIILDEENIIEMRIIGEFVKVLDYNQKSSTFKS
jgi:hypothetical protein